MILHLSRQPRKKPGVTQTTPFLPIQPSPHPVGSTSKVSRKSAGVSPSPAVFTSAGMYHPCCCGVSITPGWLIVPPEPPPCTAARAISLNCKSACSSIHLISENSVNICYMSGIEQKRQGPYHESLGPGKENGHEINKTMIIQIEVGRTGRSYQPW